MNPRGPIPQCLTLLDDCLFDAQCSADSQVLNTEGMLERFRGIFADGQVSDRDTDDVLYIFRHTRLEARLNDQQVPALRGARTHCNAVGELVTGLRGRIQMMKHQPAGG